MAYKIHERDLRGTAKTGWLDSRHTFSFGHFHDPSRMGFRSLRVINEDKVIPGAGFGTHPHDNMEIISYVLDGELKHEDSMGTGSIITPGEIQKMSAGTGVTHSEFNPSQENGVHFLQIWIEPDTRDVEPSYEQITPDMNTAQNGFTLVGGPDGGDNIVTIHQDAKLFVAKPEAEEELSYNLADGRHAFIQIVRGEVELKGERLKEGDGVEISDVAEIKLKANVPSELLLFDLA